jgi:hypothetical protein
MNIKEVSNKLNGIWMPLTDSSELPIQIQITDSLFGTLEPRIDITPNKYKGTIKFWVQLSQDSLKGFNLSMSGGGSPWGWTEHIAEISDKSLKLIKANNKIGVYTRYTKK